MMRVLVTGGAGYLGSVLVGKLLAKGFGVVVLDILMFGGESLLAYGTNPQFSFLRGDIRKKSDRTQALAGINAICHLAALVGEPACAKNPALTREINFSATASLIQEAKEAGARRFLFASSCSNYGLTDSGSFATEDSPLRPLSLYAETKIQGEQEVLARNDANFCATVVRLATIFGLSPRMRFNLLINEMVRDAHFGKKLIIYKADAWRPFTHIEDAAEAIVSVLAAPRKKVSGAIFNVGTENYQKKELVKLIGEFATTLNVEKKGGVTDNRDYRVSFDKIKKILGFRPQKTIRDGMRDMFRAIGDGVFVDPYDERYTRWINEDLLLQYSQ